MKARESKNEFMKRCGLKQKVSAAAALVVAAIFLLPADAAAGWKIKKYEHPKGYHWHKKRWWYGDCPVPKLEVGTTIAELPPRTKIVLKDDLAYYYDGTYYFQPMSSGYIVVEKVIGAKPPPKKEPRFLKRPKLPKLSGLKKLPALPELPKLPKWSWGKKTPQEAAI